ncbi:hypothetical protein X756_31460 [Mesorhizobium sp. LSHC412B00]|nr:hypothetical protein X756_31460 [Mesorhizobium sp. LSHC412B00]
MPSEMKRLKQIEENSVADLLDKEILQDVINHSRSDGLQLVDEKTAIEPPQNWKFVLQREKRTWTELIGIPQSALGQPRFLILLSYRFRGTVRVGI